MSVRTVCADIFLNRQNNFLWSHDIELLTVGIFLTINYKESNINTAIGRLPVNYNVRIKEEIQKKGGETHWL